METPHSPIPPHGPYNQQFLLDWLGAIDLYLLDQVMKHNLEPGMRILDAGCGHGRNSHYFLRTGYEVYGVDAQQEMIDYVHEYFLTTSLERSRFTHHPVEQIPHPDNFFDAVICNAVLHFSENVSHFNEMVDAMWRVLKPGGLFFARLCSDIGIEKRIQPLGDQRFLLPDGSARFVVTEEMLFRKTQSLGGSMPGPLKTVNVQHQRCMTNWVMVKG